MVFLRCNRTRHNTSPKKHARAFTDILRYIHRGSWVFVFFYYYCFNIPNVPFFNYNMYSSFFFIFLGVKVYDDRVKLTSDPVLCKVALIKEFSHWTSRKRHLSFCLSSWTFASQALFCVSGVWDSLLTLKTISPRPPHHPSKLRVVSVATKRLLSFEVALKPVPAFGPLRRCVWHLFPA